jgi:protein-S-isoprenylcysteine O-methyltransferase Ste14
VAGAVVIAIWAWGDWRGYLQSPARWGTLLATALYRAGIIASLNAGWSTGRREDRHNRWIMLPLVGCAAVLLVASPFCDRRGLWVLDGDPVRYAGLALSWLGTWLRLAAIFALRHRFSALVAIQDQHDLITTGPYSLIRHPAYLGGMGILLGWALTFRSLVGVIAFAAMFALLVVRMNSEEALLTSHFGEEYTSYMRRTKRLIPFLY